MRKDLGPTLAQIAQGRGESESLMRRALMVEDVEAIAFKNGWEQVDGENQIVALPCPCTPCSSAKASSHLWVWAKGTDWPTGAQVQKLWTSVLTLMPMYLSLLSSQ